MGDAALRAEPAQHASEARQRSGTDTTAGELGRQPEREQTQSGSLSVRNLLLLQRAAGNAAVAELLSRSPSVQRDDAPSALADRPALDRKPDGAPSPFGEAAQEAPLNGQRQAGAAPPARPAPAPAPPLASPAVATGQPAMAPAPAIPAVTPVGDAGQTAPPAASTSAVGLASSLAPAPPAPPTSGSPSLLRFHQIATTRRTQLFTQSDARELLIRQAAATVKADLQTDHAAEATAVQAVFAVSISQITASQQTARTDITASRDAKVEDVRQAAETELVNLDKAVADKRTAMRDAGATRRQAASAFGEEEAKRATAECNQKAADAIAIGESKAAAYQSRDRGAEMGAEARKMAADAATQIHEAAAAIATTARKDAGSLGEKFTEQATEAAASLADGQPAARKKIEQERDQATQGLRQMADQALAQLDKAATDMTASLELQRAGVVKQAGASGDGAAAGLDALADRAVQSHQNQTLKMCADLDQFTAGIGPGTAADEDIDQAGDYMVSILDRFDSASQQFLGDSSKAFDAGASDAGSRVKAQLAPLVAPIQNIGVSFQAQSVKAAGDVARSMGDAATKSSNAMKATVGDVNTNLQKSIDDNAGKWDQQLTDGKAEISGKVNRGIEEQSRLVQGLPARMDERAQAIADATWLSRTLSFIGGVLWGFLKALAIAVVVILAIALVVLLVVLFVVYVLPEGLAIILAVAIFASVNAAAIAAVLEVLGFMVALVVVMGAIFLIYQAATRDDLNPEQRGELVGAAIFDVATLIFGEAIIGKLAEWLRIRVPAGAEVPPRVPGEIPVDPVPGAAAAPRIADPGAFGRAIGAELRGQRGSFYIVCDRVTAAKLSQADAVTAVEGATKEMGLDLSRVPMDDGSIAVASVRAGTDAPVVVVQPDGSTFYGSADLVVDPGNAARPLRLENVRPRGAAGPTAGGGTATATATREITTTPVQLQSKFKHAADFGVEGNYSPANGQAFESAIKAHVQSPGVRVIEGTYRGNPARIFLDPDTGLAVVTKPSGEFVSGWRLSAPQLEKVLASGSLGGG